MRDDFPGLLLFLPQIGLGKLVDGFIEKGGASHGRLADGEGKNLIRAFVFQEFLEPILYQAPGEHFRGVVRG